MIEQEMEFGWMVECLFRMWGALGLIPNTWHNPGTMSVLPVLRRGKKFILSHVWGSKPAWATRNPLSEEKFNKTKVSPWTRTLTM